MNRTKIFTSVVLAIGITVGNALCQDPERLLGTLPKSPKEAIALLPLELSAGQRTTNAPAVPIIGRAICDKSGSIYFRYLPGKDRGTTSQVMKISSDGAATSITLPKLYGDHSVPYVLLFNVATDGKLYEIARPANVNLEQKEVTSLAVLSQTGEVLTNSTFEFNFFPNVIVPFNSGEVFVAGLRLRPSAAKSANQEPFVAVFAEDGRVKKLVTHNPAKSVRLDSGEEIVDPSIQGGLAQLGEDGNVYMLIEGAVPFLEVITPAGIIARHVKLRPPYENARITYLAIRGSRLLTLYYSKKTETHGFFAYVIYDLNNGAPVMAYEPSFTGIPSCWDEKGTLTILAPDKGGNIVLRKAELR